MPSAPVLGDGPGKEGPFKVLRQLQPEGLRDPQGNIHPAGKIGIELEGEGHGSDPDVQPRILPVIPVDRIHDLSHPLRDHQHLEKAPQHPLHPPGHLHIVEGMGSEKRIPVLPEAQDRPGKHAGKEHPVQGKLSRIFQRPRDLKIHVRHITDEREGIIGNSQRNQPVQPVQQLPFPEEGCDPVCRIDAEIDVLQQKQSAHVHKDHGGERPSALPLRLLPGILPGRPARLRPLSDLRHPPDSRLADQHGGKRIENEEAVVRKKVIKKTGQKEDHPLAFFRHNIIDQQHKRIEKQKIKGCDAQGFRSFPSRMLSRPRGKAVSRSGLK